MIKCDKHYCSLVGHLQLRFKLLFLLPYFDLDLLSFFLAKLTASILSVFNHILWLALLFGFLFLVSCLIFGRLFFTLLFSGFHDLFEDGLGLHLEQGPLELLQLIVWNLYSDCKLMLKMVLTYDGGDLPSWALCFDNDRELITLLIRLR